MWKKTKRYFDDYCEHTSIIGFNYVAEKRSKGERYLWLLLIVLAIALSIYFIMQMWFKYDENPFIVTLATRAQPIFSIPFPAVTICPVAKANRTVFNYTNVAHKLWDQEEVTPYERETTQYMTMICENDDVNRYLPQNATFTDDIYKRLDELDSTKTILEESTICTFMQNVEQCTNVLVPIISDHGICYTFNMLKREDIYKPKVQQYENFHQHNEINKWTNDNGYSEGANKNVYPRRALQLGVENGLMIIIPQIMGDTDYLCSADFGYTVTIHAPNSIPTISRNYFFMPFDTSTTVLIRPSLMTTSAIVKAYKLADRQCYFSDERYLDYFLTYTQENCYLECLANYTLQKCGCVNFFMPRTNTTKICGNAMINCMEEAENELKMLELNSQLKEKQTATYKSCNCLPLCTELSFNTETTSYPWQWKQYFGARKNLNISQETMNIMHFSMLQVFFNSDQFIPYEKNELYGPFDFLSNFGGLLGLFTGFSLLSAVELIYFISVRLWCNRRLYNNFDGPPDAEEV